MRRASRQSALGHANTIIGKGPVSGPYSTRYKGGWVDGWAGPPINPPPNRRRILRVLINYGAVAAWDFSGHPFQSVGCRSCKGWSFVNFRYLSAEIRASVCCELISFYGGDKGLAISKGSRVWLMRVVYLISDNEGYAFRMLKRNRDFSKNCCKRESGERVLSRDEILPGSS